MAAASSADKLPQHPAVCTLCATLCQWYPVLCIPSQPGCATPSLTVLHEVMEKGNSFWEPPPGFPTVRDCSTSGVQHFSHWTLHHRSSRKSFLHQIIQITAFPPPIRQARLQCTALCCKHRVGKCTSSMCPAGICWLLLVAESCDLFSTQPQISMVTAQANSCLPRGVTSFLKGKWLHICHCPSASQVPFRWLTAHFSQVSFWWQEPLRKELTIRSYDYAQRFRVDIKSSVASKSL